LHVLVASCNMPPSYVCTGDLIYVLRWTISLLQTSFSLWIRKFLYCGLQFLSGSEMSGKRICTTSRIYVENIDQPSLSKSSTFFTTDFIFCVGETNLYYIENLRREYWSAILL
jgi:hypothetical protein